MTDRPRIKIELKAGDRNLEIAGMFLLILLWGSFLMIMLLSPAIVPTHFNALGEADNYDSKFSLLFLPVLGTILYFALGKLNKYPHIFNYPVAITEDNALKQYTIATRMIRTIKAVVLLVFLIILLDIFFMGSGKSSNLGVWVLPLTVLIILLPTAWFVYKAFNVK